jgi:hypothetical protein
MPITGRSVILKASFGHGGKAMGHFMHTVEGERWRGWRVAMWGTAAVLLLLPLVAMRFTAEVDWSGSDFLVMAVMLGTACGVCELAARASGNGSYRLAAAIAVGTSFLTVWANLAVGMIGDEGNPLNLLFGGVLAIALTGAIVARFQSAGMARAMVVTAAAQALASAVGLSTDVRGAILSIGFALPWLLSAWLFRKAARED